jgi:gamma-glutamyltranspeptidase / glutathione hydrolase
MLKRSPLFLSRAWLAATSLLLGAAVAAPAQALNLADPEDRRQIEEDYFGPGATGAFQGRNGMVSTASYHATMAGLETLRAGGNAFDAAAVVQLVLTVTEPYASGIGGGLFMMLYDAEAGEVISIDGREEAPKAFHPDAFRDSRGRLLPYVEQATGGHAVGVPGTLAAVAHLLETRGTISLAEALQPAIRIARDGFIITEPFARSLETHFERLRRYPESRALFSRPNGGPLQEGDFFRNPDLARTFELIAEHGIEIFYRGEIARDIVETVRGDERRPGLITLEDLANYRPVRREPVSVEYNGHTVYGMNMPSSGGPTIAKMLNLLEQAGFADKPAGSADSLHLLIEAQNIAFADRNRFMADADFIDVPVAGIIDKDYARSRAAMIDLERALPTPVPAGRPAGAPHVQLDRPNPVEGISTTHFSIVDRQRNVASVTTTIEQHFGSALVVPGRGFLLNNELTDFDVAARDDDGRLLPNAPEGGWRPRRSALGEDAETEGAKRPRSSMTPTIVLRDGQPVLALGSPGGSRIIGITLNVLVNVIDHGMEIQSAINQPRIVSRNGPAEMETPLYRQEEVRRTLESRGFTIRDGEAFGSVQAIQIDADGWLRGAADPRREGLALGF